VVKDCFVPYWRGFDETGACETGDLFVNLARDAPHHREAGVTVVLYSTRTEMGIPIHYVSNRKKTYQARAVLNRSAFVERNLGLLPGIKIIKKQNRMEEPQCDSSCVLVIGLDMLDNQLGPSPAITQM
jgi:hypothetical protein